MQNSFILHLKDYILNLKSFLIGNEINKLNHTFYLIKMYTIYIDNREHDLILDIPNIIEQKKLSIAFKVCELQIGDIEIRDSSDNLKMIIERKTLNDLASSITDGRYREQSLRLKEAVSDILDHNKYYLIEGDITRFSVPSRRCSNTQYKKRQTIQSSTLLSVMASLSYGKGFSVIRTMNLRETAECVVQFTTKVERIDKERKLKTVSNQGDTQESISYSSVITKQKCKNITPENINEILLCQIPFIQQTTAKGLINAYGTFFELQEHIRNGTDELEKVRIKNRKLSLRVIESLRKYLGIQQTLNLKVDT